MRMHSAIAVVALGTVALGCALLLHAQTPSQQSVTKPSVTIQVVECVVYPEARTSQTFDCTSQARAACNGSVRCELPIGLGLTGGRHVDGDAHAWKKVRVRYRCGKVDRINGPHHQNDHATMLLGCGVNF